MSVPERNQQLKKFSWDIYPLQNLFSITSVQMHVERISGNQSEILYGYHKDFDDDHSGQHNHWILQNKKNGTKLCSIQSGIQNIKDDVNDNLCQLYCIMKCLNIKLPSNLGPNDITQKINKHKLMVATIRDLVNRHDFKEMLQEKMTEIQEGFTEMDFLEREHYLMYETQTRNGNKRKTHHLIDELNYILDDWDNFGYKYFINDGSW
jgi:hypothetical protein